MHGVMLTWPHAHTVSHSFMYSVLDVQRQDSAGQIREVYPVRCYPGDSLILGRNQAMQHFLASDCEWLWTVDTDMGFGADILNCLLWAGSGGQRPVVGALYRILLENDQGRGSPESVQTFPLAVGWTSDGTRPYDGFPEAAVVQVGATGAGCLLIHRSAAEKIRAEYGETWWDLVEHPVAGRMGEDFSFCWRLKELEIGLYVDTGIPTTHHKSVWI